MDYKRIKRRITEKYNRKTVDYSHYLGEVLKRKRMELSMTQEAASHGICSVSYLSKIENNKMSPNSLFVREISDRMGIDLEAYAQTFEDINVLKEGLQAFYYQDVAKLEKLLDNVKTLNHETMSDLFKLLIANLEGDYAEGDNLLTTLLPGMNNMDLFSSITIIIVASIHYYETRRYKQAYNMLHTLEEFEGVHPMLRGLESMYAYFIRQKIGKKNNSAAHYNEAHKVFSEYNHPKKLMTLHLHKLLFLAEEDPREIRRQFRSLRVECLDDEHQNQYLALKLMVEPNFAKEDAEHVLFKLQTNRKDEWFYRALALLMLANRDDIAFLKKFSRFFEEVSEPFLVEKTLYQSLLLTDKKSYKNLLRDICLPMAIDKQETFYIRYFTDELSDILVQEARYKEVHVVYQRKQRALKEMAAIRS